MFKFEDYNNNALILNSLSVHTINGEHQLYNMCRNNIITLFEYHHRLLFFLSSFLGLFNGFGKIIDD